MPRCDEHASREEPSSTRELCHDKVVRRGKPVSYALELRELPNELSRFLAAVKAYFTQKVNLERQRPPLSETTFAKSQERMLCKWTSESLLLFCFVLFCFFGCVFRSLQFHLFVTDFISCVICSKIPLNLVLFFLLCQRFPRFRQEGITRQSTDARMLFESHSNRKLRGIPQGTAVCLLFCPF